MKMVPVLRFPEFKEPLVATTLGRLFSKGNQRGHANLPIYSVTLQNGLVRRDTMQRHMASDARPEQNFFVGEGDLAYNTMRMWQGAVGLAEEDCMVSPAYVVLTPNARTYSPLFVHWFKDPRMIYLLWAYSHGLTSDRLRLYYDDFSKIPIRVPSLSEQQKIASFLSSVDRRTDLLRQKRDALELYKRGLLQKIFSQEIRFNQDDGSKFPDWTNLALGDVLHEHGEKSAGGEPVFSVSVARGLVDQIEHLGRSYSAADTSHYNKVKPYDIVYTKSPTGNFPLGIIKQSTVETDVIVSPLYGVFTPKTPHLGFILNVYFESEINVRNYLTPLVQKGAKNTIACTNSRFLEGKLKLPQSNREQEKIANFLRALQRKIDNCVSQIEQMETFKKGLLQQMFV